MSWASGVSWVLGKGSDFRLGAECTTTDSASQGDGRLVFRFRRRHMNRHVKGPSSEALLPGLPGGPSLPPTWTCSGPLPPGRVYRFHFDPKRGPGPQLSRTTIGHSGEYSLPSDFGRVHRRRQVTNEQGLPPTPMVYLSSFLISGFTFGFVSTPFVFKVSFLNDMSSVLHSIRSIGLHFKLTRRTIVFVFHFTL